MPRLKALKPPCRRCGETRYVGCYLGVWICHNPYCVGLPEGTPHDVRCVHNFQANPGMYDSAVRYCERCGVAERASFSRGSGRMIPRADGLRKQTEANE